YLRFTGRTEAQVELVEKYCKAQGLFRVKGQAAPRFTDTLSLDLGTVVPSLAGPKRPQDKIALSEARKAWGVALDTLVADSAKRDTRVSVQNGTTYELTHGNVVIAAITSCTNTSNPSVMIAAGLLARKANARGLKPKPWVKTSLAPGSKVVTEYLDHSGLTED